MSNTSRATYTQVNPYRLYKPPVAENLQLNVLAPVYYNYQAADGQLAYQVVRTPQPDGGKKFTQRHPDGHGGWIWNLEGITPLPYLLPELLQAVAAGWLVLLVEGEKCATILNAAFQAAGVDAIATCNNGGAGKWGDAQSAYLAGAHVVMLPDNDKAGRNHVITAGRALLAAGVASLKMIPLPGLAEKDDIADWLTQGNTIPDLLALVAMAGEYTPSEPDKLSVTRLPNQAAQLTPDLDHHERARLTAWAQAALKNEITDLAGLADGRFARLKAVANRLGTIAAHGLLSDSECLNALYGASLANGYAQKKGVATAEKEARWYFDDGKQYPCDLPRPNERRPVELEAAAPRKEESSVAVIREQARIAVQNYLGATESHQFFLNSSQPGVGKTELAKEIAAEYIGKGYRVVWLRMYSGSPERNQVFVQGFEKYGLTSNDFFFHTPRQDTDQHALGYCQRAKVCNTAASQGYSSGAVCQTCSLFRLTGECECKSRLYLSQLDKGKKHKIAVYSAENAIDPRIFQGTAAKAVLVVIDESPLDVVTRCHRYTRHDLKARKVISLVEQGDYSESGILFEEMNQLLDSMAYAIENIPVVQDAKTKYRKLDPQQQFGGRALFASIIRRFGGAERVEKLISLKNGYQAALFNTIDLQAIEDGELPTNAEHIVDIFLEEYDQHWKQAGVTWCSRLIPDLSVDKAPILEVYRMDPLVFPSGTKIIVNDATADPEHYQIAFSGPKTKGKAGTPFTVSPYSDYAKEPYHKGEVIQYTGSSNSRKAVALDSFEDIESDEIPAALKKLKAFMLWVFKEHGANNVLLTSYKALIERVTSWAVAQGMNPANFNHFGQGTGSNQWEHLSVGVVFGTPRIAELDVLKQANLYHHGEKALGLSKTTRNIPYPGLAETYPDDTAFEDPRVEAMRLHIIQREFRQSIGRTRPDTNLGDKHVYVLSDFPAGVQVDKLESRQLYDLSADVKAYMLTEIKKGRTFSYAEVVQAFPERRKQTVRDVCKRVHEELKVAGIADDATPPANKRGEPGIWIKGR
ncbi:MAG: hypothetical protein ABI947_02515 [Chloroflexota bacterium]